MKKTVENKLKKLCYDRIYKTKMVRKKNQMHKHKTTKAVKYEVYDTLPNINIKQLNP